MTKYHKTITKLCANYIYNNEVNDTISATVLV